MLGMLAQQTFFEEMWDRAKNAVENANPVEVWGTVLIIVGIVFAALLIVFTEYKRQERDSVKFSMIMITMMSVCIGFGTHMRLVAMRL
jgi:uncharacterized membrane protein